MTQQQLDNYAALLLWSVGGVQGRRLMVIAEPVSQPLARAVARAAYRHGASLVALEYSDPMVARARVEFAAEPDLTTFPEYRHAWAKEVAGDDWSLIRIAGSDEPDHMAGLDAARIGVHSKARAELNMPILEKVTRFTKHWVGALLPTRELAIRACPDLDPDAALERYESEVSRVLSLDADPVGVWSATLQELARRRDRLNAVGLDSLHFTGPGTDLTIGLHPGGQWATAQARMPDGRTACVNMPSFEVFTTPDLRRTSGTVRASRPFLLASAPGVPVEGAWFHFSEGRVTDCGASSGQDVLQQVLDMDENARCLGEIALVDSESAVAKAGFIFHNTLYDENAATHMGLGRGFPGLVPGAGEMDPSELVAAGINHSVTHNDIMIGSPEIDVDGRSRSGEVVPLMRAGSFVE